MTTGAPTIPPGITPGPGYVGPARNVEVKSLGVGTAAPGTAGYITATSVSVGRGPNTANDQFLCYGITASESVVFSRNAYVGLGTAGAVITGSWRSTPGTAKPLTLVSGTALEATTASDTTVMVQLSATVAGHASVTIGPTTGAEHVVATDLTMVAGSSQVVPVKVPFGWKIIVTVVTVVISRALAVRG